MRCGNLEHKIVATALIGVGSPLMWLGPRWIQITGVAICTAGCVVLVLGPLLWFLAEMVAEKIDRLRSR